MQSSAEAVARIPRGGSDLPKKVLTQRKYDVALIFQFETDRLDYTLRDRSGERQFPIRYEMINLLEPSTLVVNHSRRFARWAVLVAFVCFILSAVASAHDPLVGDVFLVLFGVLSIFSIYAQKAHLFSIKYTVFPIGANAERPLFRVMDTQNRQDVLDELQARWRGRIKELHGTVNFMGDIDKEIARFDWLKSHAVITDAEHEQAVAKLRAYAAQQRRPVDTRPN